MKRSIEVLLILLLQCITLYSQPYLSKDNYTGTWETPESWNPTWLSPQSIINGYNISINGFITANSNLSFTGTTSELIVHDTLVIKGDLVLDNNNDLTINDGGILIVRGNLTIGNQTRIVANGYFIITGNLIKASSINLGSFTSNDNPVKVFIGDSISSVGLTDNNPNYPVLNTVSPATIPYPNSAFAFGNTSDLMNDPIYSFFQTTCTTTTPTITADGPTTFCDGDSVTLTSSEGSTYVWSTGATTASINATAAGSYTVQVTDANGCQSLPSAAAMVDINALPLVTITSSSNAMCINDLRTLTGSPTGGTFMITDGPGTIAGNVLTASGTGNINLEYNYTGVCSSKATQSIIIAEKPIASAGPDQELQFVFETLMQAELTGSETGEWSLISGSGTFGDIHSPSTRVTELSLGENVFLWNVQNGNCDAGEEVIITVYDLVIPSVITPNEDGKNDYFIIPYNTIPAELTIFNRWGNIEFTNDNYENDWSGRNNNGTELTGDTYFYVLKFENGIIQKGSVLIKR